MHPELTLTFSISETALIVILFNIYVSAELWFVEGYSVAQVSKKLFLLKGMYKRGLISHKVRGLDLIGKEIGHKTLSYNKSGPLASSFTK